MDKNKVAVDTYNKISKIYASKYFNDLADSSYIDDFLKTLKRGSKVLDVGCGPGTFTKYILGKGFNAEGVDLSDEMIDIARNKVPNAAFGKMDMRNLKYGDNIFDGLLVAYSLIHMRLLKP